MYDAIVVGARCGGSPTAMLLARMGYKVLVVDRAGFPSDTLSTHYIHQSGAAYLKRWGLLERIVAAGAPAIRSFTLDIGPFALRGTPPAIDGVADAYSLRRSVLGCSEPLAYCTPVGFQRASHPLEHYTAGAHRACG